MATASEAERASQIAQAFWLSGCGEDAEHILGGDFVAVWHGRYEFEAITEAGLAVECRERRMLRFLLRRLGRAITAVAGA